jgi:hypothetical protein
MALPSLLLGTTSGVYQLALKDGASRLAALRGNSVTHLSVAASGKAAAAAVAVPGPVHSMYK